MTSMNNPHANDLLNIRRFDGSEDVDTWVGHVLDVKDYLEWTEARTVKAACLCLIGDAQGWWNALRLEERRQLTTIHELKAALLRRFPSRDVHTQWQQFTTLHCDNTCTVRQYTDHFRRLADRLRITDQGVLLHQYIRGLQRHMQAHVIRAAPQSLKEVIDAALQEERVQECVHNQHNLAASMHDHGWSPSSHSRANKHKAVADREQQHLQRQLDTLQQQLKVLAVQLSEATAAQRQGLPSLGREQHLGGAFVTESAQHSYPRAYAITHLELPKHEAISPPQWLLGASDPMLMNFADLDSLPDDDNSSICSGDWPAESQEEYNEWPELGPTTMLEPTSAVQCADPYNQEFVSSHTYSRVH